MKVTVCQLDNRPDRLERDWRRLDEHVRGVGSDLVLLPEMCFAEWLAARPQADGARWQAAVEAHEAWLGRLDELAPATVVSSRPVLDGEARRNRAYVHAPGAGLTDVHDKAYLPDEEGFWEASWYGAGPADFPVFEAAGARCGVQICTEMWFLRHARDYAEAGAHLLCVPRATGYEMTGAWLAGGRTAGVVAGAFCLSSNLWQPPGGAANLGGVAWITDPQGQVLATTSPETPFATAEVDPGAAEAAKATYPRYVRDP